MDRKHNLIAKTVIAHREPICTAFLTVLIEHRLPPEILHADARASMTWYAFAYRFTGEGDEMPIVG